MNIPQEVENILNKLREAGFEAYIVGGCVRDLLRKVEPNDWDITTKAKPKEIQQVMEKAGLKTFYENEFFTVGVVWPKKHKKEKEIKEIPDDIIEVTTFRSEAKYSDKRHPDKVEFAETLKEDLSRRDFTVNAMAINREKEIIDPFKGKQDLEKKIIRAVGSPKERFAEDALRMLRAVRFSVSLGKDWKIEEKTTEAIKENSSSLKAVSEERIRDELIKIVMSERAAEGIELLRQFSLLTYIIPELEEGYGVSQNKHHIYDCYEHNLKSLEYAAKKNFNLRVRMAALLHDVAKPRCKQGEGENATFYNHEIVSAKMTARILDRLRFPRKEADKITNLVGCHLFYYNVGEVGESSVRRLVAKAGPENMEELLQLRMADRIGSGVPKAEPYKLRHLRYVIEKVSQDPISVKKLEVGGKDVMDILRIKPSPKVGQILDVLLGYVLLDPKKNKKELLEKEIIKLGKLSSKDLISLAEKAKKEVEKIETKKDEMTKKKYWVT
jgi:tRNA nucleotidyltransferase (CCA-adding enzyme)